MNARNRSGGFTIRELLVLIAIIGLILALLAPMMHRSSCYNRGTTCRNNMKNITLSIFQYETVHNHYPGFQDSVTDASGRRFSRPLLYMVMPQLERGDIFERFGANKHPYDGVPGWCLDLMVCPSAARNKPSDAANYIYNTGMPDVYSAPAPPDWPANGVFRNRCLHDALKIALGDNDADFINSGDGLTNTLLLSERRELLRWTDTAEHDVGFVWHPRFEKEPFARINSRPPSSYAASKYLLARPSSNHPGIVNVAFCDGHVRTIAEGIDYRVYAQLMTPRGSDATYPGLRDGRKEPVEDDFRGVVLRDECY